MKPCRTILLSFLLMLLAFPVWAMENHSDILRDQYGRAMGGASVAVYNAGTSTLSTIYSDNGSTAKSNPFLTNALDGSFNFYAANGVYDLVYTYPGATFDVSHTRRISLFDVNDFSGGGGGGSGWCYRSVTSTPYTVVAADNACLLQFNSASQIAVTIPQAGTTGFGTSFRFTALNSGSANVVFTPTTSTIQGVADLTLEPGQSTDIASDGSNYWYTPGITADTGWPSSSENKEITWANAFANAALFGNGTNKWALYNDPTDGLQHICVVAGVANACNYIRKLAAGKYVEFQNSSGTNIGRLTESTGAWTNFTINTEGTGNTITLKKYLWLPAGGCNGSTASTAWDLPTSNPAVAACRTGTNTTKGVLEFADGANALTAQWHELLSEDWTGTIDASIVWQSGSTSTNNVVWQLAIACSTDGASDDPAFTDNVFTADANKATANQYNYTSANVITTTGSCAAWSMMHVRVKRDPAHASDNLAATAQLVGVSLRLREAQ